MVIQEEGWVSEQNQRELQAIEGKTSNIEIEDSCAARTINGFRTQFRANGLEISSEDDYPHDQFTQLKYLKEFDAQVNPEAKIEKRIISIVRQPITVMDGNKRVTKDALYFNAEITGENFAGVRKSVEYQGGYWLEPKMTFQLNNPSRPFNPQTGEKEGSYKVTSEEYIHDLFVPESKTERKKFFQDLLDKWPDTFIDELETGYRLMVRQASPQNRHSGPHGGKFSWDVYTSLSLKDLTTLQDTGYFKDSDGILKDSKLQRVNYNQATGKIEAIK